MRARITVAVAVLSALALTGAGVAAALVERQRTEQRIVNAVDDELTEFKGLLASQGEPGFRDIAHLTKTALERNVPDEHEVLGGWWRDQAQIKQGGQSQELLTDPALETEVRRLLALGGGSAELATSVGDVLLAVQPVDGPDDDGAFLVAYLSGDERDEFSETVKTYAVVAVLALLLVTLGAWSVSGRLLAPVRELRATAQEITDTDLSRRIPVEGDDDISDLVRTVNAMLERLDRAFATQRTFLDDAGHELRTPVTVLRGHLELLDPYDSRDVTATRQLLLDEIDRMSRMVDDLILLAKADRPDFLQPVPVEVGALTDQVFDKARATADRDWRVDERATGTARLDAQRVTQALLQLASNAIRHTDRGDLVAFGSRTDQASVRFWVRDGGPGVAEDLRETIFERFRQGPQPRATDGSGLGLSIVRAIADAHGGQVRVESPPGQGATFVLTLPRSTDPRTFPGGGGHE